MFAAIHVRAVIVPTRELVANFDRVSEHIDADRPDLVVNTGDIDIEELLAQMGGEH
ncbi:hypothetical protein [Bradyrhizobium sp. 199]|uniref:hypothetical protein n=1 Tax=Bradyrhizobium sp. 199 TaxID=2782664 RepID=UPI001FFBC01F|nr:hypothetical protein [Bradyrhizobium sp. 199]